MSWPFPGAKRERTNDYRLERPLADCPGCWKARAVALYWMTATCRECHRVHRARWLHPRPGR
jgi:hypothetical protein